MLRPEITENCFFEAAKMDIWSKYDLWLCRTESRVGGPFYLVSSNCSPFYKEGLALGQVAELCDFDLGQVRLVRRRRITRILKPPATWTDAEKLELSKRRVASGVPV